MKIKKLSLFIFALVLVGCSSTYEDIHTSTPLAQPEPFSTITAIPTIAHQLTNTPKPLPTLTFIPSPTPLAESTQSISCWQSAMAQLEMNQCASQEYQVKYDKLNELIVELKSHMNDTQYEILLRVQADWKNTIEEHCQWQANFFEGGSVQPMWHAICLTQQYRDRIEALRLNLCMGNGMTGECEESLKYKQ